MGARVVAAAICVVLLAALSVAFPSKAHAWFNDTASSFPAAQDLGTFDDPIRGSQLPDGTYKVTARTTSSMCIFYTNPADAEARDSKEQAIISVQNGNITGVFYISRAYNYLYMGTQEEAAAATNADGTDASNYIAGDPSEGYVPHLFMMDVPALNVPITFSSFSGGNNGLAQGVWYTREVVFGMTNAEYEQIIMDWHQQQDPEDGSQENGSNPGYHQVTFVDGWGNTLDVQTVAEGGAAIDPGAPSHEGYTFDGWEPSDFSAVTSDLVVTATWIENEGSDNQQGILTAGDADASDSGNQLGGQTEEQSQDGDSQTQQSTQQAVPQTGEMRGVKMNIVSPNELTVDMEIDTDDVDRSDKDLGFGLTPRQILMLVLVGMLIAGIAARVLIFNRSYENVDGPPTPPLSKAPGGKSGTGQKADADGGLGPSAR